MENAVLEEPRHASNFSWAFLSLPADQRQGLDALYRYCREVDDIVDETHDPNEAKRRLEQWRRWLEAFPKPSQAPKRVEALARATEHFSIDVNDLLWILRGVEQDLVKSRYETFADLLHYCDAVASAVGLATLSICGIPRDEGYEYAMATGRALQLTNILRDVASDLTRDRIYLPLDDLQVFGYTEEELKHHIYNMSFKRLMAFQADRARTFYQDASLARPKQLNRIAAPEIMRRTYRSILDNIIEADFDVFERKVGITWRQKWTIIRMISQAWLRHTFGSVS